MTTPSDKPLDPAGSVTFRANALWFGETGYPEEHPSQMLADISSDFAEATSDSLVVLDNLSAVDLLHANEEWRLAMVEALRRDAEHVAKLYRNAMQIATTLEFSEEVEG